MTAAHAPAPVTELDRLGFAVFLALALHAAVVLGVTFSRADPEPPPRTLEVTLAQFSSERPPERADFLAQADQRGSGTRAEVRELTTTEEASLPDVSVREVEPVPPRQWVEAARPPPPDASPDTRAEPERREPDPTPVSETELADPQTLIERFRELASLDARLAAQRQDYARRPRVRRLTSVSTRRTSDAYYMASWRRRIERIGTRMYQAGAHQQQIVGSLRMLVSIEPDGTLREARVLESSGNPVLDETALRIVRNGAPFAPFPDEMRRNVDVLEIIRTFQFRDRGLFQSQ